MHYWRSRQYRRFQPRQRVSTPACSWYCVGQRPVITLKRLNSHVKSEHFKMESLHTVKSLLQKGDWMTKIDLKDAFFMVPIAKHFHHLLLFRVNAAVPVSPIWVMHCPEGVYKSSQTSHRVTEDHRGRASDLHG